MLALKKLSMCTAVSGGLFILSHAHGSCPTPPQPLLSLVSKPHISCRVNDDCCSDHKSSTRNVMYQTLHFHNYVMLIPYFWCVQCKVCNISILNSMMYVLDGKDRRTEQQARLRRKCCNTLVWTILYRTSYIHVCMSGIYSDLAHAQQLWYFLLQNKLVILSV